MEKGKWSSNVFAAARKMAGIDQSEFGEMYGLTAARISQYEKDPSIMPLGVARGYYGIASEGLRKDMEKACEDFIFAR